MEMPQPLLLLAPELSLERLAAHHLISVSAMKAAQSLDPSVQARLKAAIKAVEPWYPPAKAASIVDAPDEAWIRISRNGTP